MNDEKQAVRADDLSEAQAGLLARIRRAQGRGGAVRAEGEPVRESAHERAAVRMVGHGVAVDAEGLLARKDAELADVVRAWDAFRKLFESFSTGTGYLARELRQPVNEFEASVMIRAREIQGLFEKARKS